MVHSHFFGWNIAVVWPPVISKHSVVSPLRFMVPPILYGIVDLKHRISVPSVHYHHLLRSVTINILTHIKSQSRQTAMLNVLQ